MRSFILIFFVFLSFLASGQIYVMDGNPILDCEGALLDPGGNNNYAPSLNVETTICAPVGSPMTHIQLTFNGHALGSGDDLCIYDGSTTGSPLVGCITSFSSNDPFIIQATAANSSGCLTLVFTSDGTDQAAGFEAAISCIPSCQTIIAVLDTPSVYPQMINGYIDICPGDVVLFSASGEYPQNNIAYAQSDFTSTFVWDFGDGYTGYGLNNVAHIYENPGGYIAQLTITDPMGCTNSNYFNIRVRVASPPTFNIVGDNQTITVGDTINLASLFNPTADGYVENFQPLGTFTPPFFGGEETFLDDTPSGGVVCYEPTINVSAFAPGQVLTDVNDLVGLCLNMEHSYLGDLEISIISPNGVEVILHGYSGGGSCNLGVPVASGAVDGNTSNLNPGQGFDYCWVPSGATYGTFAQEANNFQNSFPSSSGGTYTDEYLPAGSYTSFSPLNALVGEPLNGVWTLKVCDHLSLDNGYIFYWNIQFDPSIYPTVETFTPQSVTEGWLDQSTIVQNDIDGMLAVPNNPGTSMYTYQIVNDFGCVHDTVLRFNVLPDLNFSCDTLLPDFTDTSYCFDVANPVSISYNLPDIDDTIEQTFTFNGNFTVDNASCPPATPCSVPLLVTMPGVTFDANSFVEICIDSFIFDTASDLEMFLQSPSGTIVELMDDNGSNGDNLIGTCFTFNAINPISGTLTSDAPFTGNWLPNGNLNDFNGESVDGVWNLIVADDLFLDGANQTLYQWHMTFTTSYTTSYTWSSSSSVPGNLSCTDCSDPVLTPTETTTYNVTLSDNLGCMETDQFTVTIDTTWEAPTVTCGNVGATFVEFNWNAIPNAGSYEVNIDGSGWVNVGNVTTFTENFGAPQNVTIEVRVPGNCSSIGTQTCGSVACDLVASIHSTDASCAGANDGTVWVEATSSFPPFTFQWDANAGNAADSLVTGLAPGNYCVTVTDLINCDTVMCVDVNGPAPIAISMDSTNISCTTTGTATVNVLSGGVLPLTYQWNDAAMQTTPTASNLNPGTYIVTVTDSTNCFVIDSVMVESLGGISITSDSLPANCAGQASGSAWVEVTGGSLPFTYNWSGVPQNNDTIINVLAGNYTVTVSDAAGCSAVTNVVITEPAPLVLDSTQVLPVGCPGESSGGATVFMSGGTGNLTYAWSNLSTGSSISNVSGGVYQFTVTDGNNCTFTDMVDIPVPTDSVNTTAMLVQNVTCPGAGDGAVTSFTVGGTPDYFYVWTDANGDTVSFSMTAINLVPGTYNLETTDNRGCSDFSSIVVVEPAPITVVMDTVQNATCSGGIDGILRAIASGGNGVLQSDYQFEWSTFPTQFGNTANGLIGGETYTVTVTDMEGCSAVNSAVVPMAQALQATAGSFPADCYGNFTGSVFLNFVNGGNPPYTYSIGNFTNVPFGDTISGLQAGGYTILIQDSLDCEIEIPIEIDQPSEIEAEYDIQNVNCQGDTSGTIDMTLAGGSGNYTVAWSTGDTAYTLRNLPSGDYTVVVTDDLGCTFTDQVSISEPDDVLVATAFTEPTTCNNGRDGVIHIDAMGGTQPYSFSIDSLNYDGAFTKIGLEAGEYTAYVQDANGCLFTIDGLEVDEPVANSLAAAAQDTIIEFGDSTQILSFINVTPPDTAAYVWSHLGPASLSCYDCPNPVASPIEDTKYFLEVTDSDGCMAIAEVMIRVTRNHIVYVPNGFSPNGDGYNDVFFVNAPPQAELEMFRVFDRWGEVIFERRGVPANDSTNGWDGKFNGKDVNQGVYTWYCRVRFKDGEIQLLKGHITLVR